MAHHTAHHPQLRLTPAARTLARHARRTARRARPHLPFLIYALITLGVMAWMLETICRIPTR